MTDVTKQRTTTERVFSQQSRTELCSNCRCVRVACRASGEYNGNIETKSTKVKLELDRVIASNDRGNLQLAQSSQPLHKSLDQVRLNPKLPRKVGEHPYIALASVRMTV